MDVMPIYKLNRVCPICGKPDWCGISADGLFAFCPRIEKGSIGEYGRWGWIHPLDQKKDFGACRAKSKAKVHWKELHELYQQDILLRCPEVVWEQLVLGVGWDGKAWIYPTYNERREIVGMQRRFPDGTKLHIKGSKDGIFWPFINSFTETLLITEGVSDCMTALLMGFNVIGRSNCVGGKDIILKLLIRRRKCSPLIIADNDKVGIEGAKKLQKTILATGRSCEMLVPPVKDLREWYEKEGDDVRKKILEYYDGSKGNIKCRPLK